MNSANQYDYIIAGMGCAGLSLAVHLCACKELAGKKVLLVDKEQKNRNDRTWCFWEKEDSIFEPIVYKKWRKVGFYSNELEKVSSADPYTYKMIRGIDFYKYSLSIVEKHSNFHIVHSEVAEVFPGGIVLSNGERILGEKVFSSIPASAFSSRSVTLLQHFKGWMIKTSYATFDDSVARMMDFRTGQEKGTTFCYVLPVSPDQALIEHTIFSPSLAEPGFYEERLKEYIRDRLGISEYEILEEEFGVIPMTDNYFPERNGSIIYIGTAGGQTKGSTGYTFRFIQKQCERIVNELVSGKALPSNKQRFRFYDSVLLRVLKKGSVPGDEIFTTMFRENSLQSIFRFLDNESTVAEEIGIIRSLPTMPFLKAAISKVF